MKTELYSIGDFIYWVTKYNENILHDKKFTHSQIESVIGRAMIDFFADSETPY